MLEIWNAAEHNENAECGIKVALNPEGRSEYINFLLSLDGLSHVQEDRGSAYCPISLTSTPDELKLLIKRRQEVLKQVLQKAGITAYDPATSPFSPDRDLSVQPNEVYLVDSGKIVGSRYFVGHNILPSTGYGIEAQKAVQFNRIPVILMDSRIRVSRMQPPRSIYLQYVNFEEQADDFVKVFEHLQHYEPGMGFNNGIPVLLGFTQSGDVVDLEESVYKKFPHLQYHYNGTTPILKVRAENPHLFYEKVN
ncbi:MAG: hypothetical protein A2857_05265 [Candidatus Levybacteria bacterium RIFCSPHIGHO2_01_FULL_36_15]|nr:MAG: hypothetical protein A2857_05265 [Candidatus Levybacteria bacterium RIFCSPHIGHO2_01_FULL_36_15]OGH38466.1 MAG: hypothetical protein A2905_01515 [Candidatus Levybacteria bacterium RIFCSPLOWO2_01_FULL_36_10]